MFVTETDTGKHRQLGIRMCLIIVCLHVGKPVTSQTQHKPKEWQLKYPRVQMTYQQIAVASTKTRNLSGNTSARNTHRTTRLNTTTIITSPPPTQSIPIYLSRYFCPAFWKVEVFVESVMTDKESIFGPISLAVNLRIN